MVSTPLTPPVGYLTIRVANEIPTGTTLNHELLHVGTAIIDYYGEEYDGEPAAYLQGYLMQKVVEEIAVPCR